MADHFMIDLETMSTAADASILSIGVQPFDPRGDGIDVGAGLLLHVDLQACMNAGLRVDASTIQWWLTQDDDARAGLVARDEGLLLSAALQALTAWGQANGGWSWAKVWSNGAAFDIPILETAYRRCRMDIPWQYNNVLDVRTMKWIAPEVARVDPVVKHNALSDAQAQAVYVQRCRAAIKEPVEITGTPVDLVLVPWQPIIQKVRDGLGEGVPVHVAEVERRVGDIILDAVQEGLEGIDMSFHSRTSGVTYPAFVHPLATKFIDALKPSTFFVLFGNLNGEEDVKAIPAGGGLGVMADGWYYLKDDDPDGVGPYFSREEALRAAAEMDEAIEIETQAILSRESDA